MNEWKCSIQKKAENGNSFEKKFRRTMVKENQFEQNLIQKKLNEFIF